MPNPIARVLRCHPRLAGIGIGIFVFGLLCLLSEVVFGLLEQGKDRRVVVCHKGLTERHELLGVRLARDKAVKAVTYVDGEPAFEVTCTLDSWRRRATPVRDREQRDRFIAFFGGSFAFGQGVNDDETLPYYVGEGAPRYMPYNYGAPAQGPQHMLLRIQEPALKEGIPVAQGIAVYVYIPDHVNRAIGAMPAFNQWMRRFPYFRLEDGALVHDGSFETGRPVTSWFYDVLYRSRTLRYFDVNLPLRHTERHRDLFVAIVAASARRFREVFPDSTFWVTSYYSSEDNGWLAPRLKEEGIGFLGYGSALQNAIAERGRESLFLRDGHPRPEVNRLIAGLLVQDLGIGAQ